MTVERLVDDLDLRRWQPHREADPSLWAPLIDVIREARAAQPHRMTLKLPNSDNTAIIDQTVTGRRVGALIVLEGVPDSITRIAEPLTRALRIPEVIIGMGDVPDDKLALSWSRLAVPYVRFARHLPLTEVWAYRGADGKTAMAAAAADTVCHELLHCFDPNLTEDEVVTKTNQFLLYGALPGGPV